MNCEKCPLQGRPNHPDIPDINENTEVLYIISKPSLEDIMQGVLLCQQSDRGKMFRTELQKVNKPYSIISIVECCYSEKLTKSLYKYCVEGIPEFIQRVSPVLIVCLGDIPAKVLLGIKGTKKTLGTYTYQGIPTIVTHSPSYALRGERQLRDWQQSFLPVIRHFQKFDTIKYTQVEAFNIQGLVALDIETSSLNPVTGKIKSVSISNGTLTEGKLV